VAAPKTESLAASGRAGARRLGDEGEDAKRKKERHDEDETRSVGGRLFRQEGNAWIDTAYNSSASVTTVKRGSEQYRALVADEPGLKTISEQLRGPVVVVWKGRVYRIQ
jgi:hypothetical protein